MENHLDALKKAKGSLKRRIRTLARSLKKEENRLAECLQWQMINHRAELIQAHLYQIKKGDKEIWASDWELEGKLVRIELDPTLKAHEEVGKTFKRAKKLQKGIPFAEREIKRISESLLLNKEFLENLEATSSEEELEFLKQNALFPSSQARISKEERTPVKPYHEHISATGIPIWVGKSAAMNDKLTFQLASGNDLWMHASGVSGSHVIVRTKNQEVDSETFNEALKLTLYHSKGRLKEGEVVVTKVKHVKRIGKQKGKVQIAHEKRYFFKDKRPLY